MRNQNIIDLYIPSGKNLEKIIIKIASQINIDTKELFKNFNDENFALKYGFSISNFPTIIIPNTYEIYGDLNNEGLFNYLERNIKNSGIQID